MRPNSISEVVPEHEVHVVLQGQGEAEREDAAFGLDKAGLN